MTKYIHYLDPNIANVLISDNADESERGYTLGLAISCDCFDEVLQCMMVTNLIPFSIQNNVVTNETLSGFRYEFMRCMDVIDKFAHKEYLLRAFKGDCVTLFAKKTVPRGDQDQWVFSRKERKE